MAAGATYEPIASITLGSSQYSVSFTSIPGTYTDLVLVTNAKTPSAKDIYYRLNDDTSTNYSCTFISGTGSTAGTGRQASQNQGQLDQYGYMESTDGQVVVAQWNNYTHTGMYKTVISKAVNATNGASGVVDLWRSTSAITKITLFAGSLTDFSSGSTFSLYGITAA